MKSAILILALFCALPAAVARAQTTGPTTREAQVAITSVTEEGEKLVRAVVNVDGKPLENATVRFSVARTFGDLLIGEDKTLDDGSAAVKFPVGLPGNAGGELHVIAQIKAPAEFSGFAEADLAGGLAAKPPEIQLVPRALWSRRAPVPLLLSLFVPLSGVWCAYVFVIRQVIGIRKGAKS